MCQSNLIISTRWCLKWKSVLVSNNLENSQISREGGN
jgi:hypothetical protein